jgi:hypothetical protein
MKSKFNLIIIISILLTVCNEPNDSIKAKTISNNDFSKRIIDVIVNDMADEIEKYFDDTVHISEKVPLESFNKNDKYGGFSIGKGLLYAIFFDIKKVNGKWKKLIYECDYSSLKDALSRSKNIQNSLESKSPQIAIEFNKKVYNIFFKKFPNNSYRIVEITLSATADDEKCW